MKWIMQIAAVIVVATSLAISAQTNMKPDCEYQKKLFSKLYYNFVDLTKQCPKDWGKQLTEFMTPNSKVLVQCSKHKRKPECRPPSEVVKGTIQNLDYLVETLPDYKIDWIMVKENDPRQLNVLPQHIQIRLSLLRENLTCLAAFLGLSSSS